VDLTRTKQKQSKSSLPNVIPSNCPWNIPNQ